MLSAHFYPIFIISEIKLLGVEQKIVLSDLLNGGPKKPSDLIIEAYVTIL